MPTHKPGPWRVGHAGNGRTYINESSGLPVAIATQHDEREFNANLIAAAPDLIALARYIVRLESSPLMGDKVPRAVREMALAAVDKAEGRS